MVSHYNASTHATRTYAHMKKLNKFQQKLLRIAFLVMDRDMNYLQEEEIMKKANASVSDLYELTSLLEDEEEFN